MNLSTFQLQGVYIPFDCIEQGFDFWGEVFDGLPVFYGKNLLDLDPNFAVAEEVLGCISFIQRKEEFVRPIDDFHPMV